MLKRIFCFWFCVASAWSSGHALEQINSEKFWEEIGLTATELQEVVDYQDCYRSQWTYLGCVFAVNALYRHTGTGNRFLLRAGIAPEEILLESGPLVVAPVEADETFSLKVIFKNRRDYLEQLQASFAVSADQGERVDFAMVFQDALGRLQMESASEKTVSVAVPKAINAFFSATVDPHTRIVPVGFFRSKIASPDQDYVGIGCYIKEVDGKIIVSSPIQGGPGLGAGLKAGDWITHIDGVSTDGQNSDTFGQLIKGKAQTIVNLTIRRNSKELQFRVERQRMVIENVEVRAAPLESGNAATIRLRSFMDANLQKKILSNLKKLSPSFSFNGVVLDLRSNGGGLVAGAQEVAEIFLDRDLLIVEQRDLEGRVLRRLRSGFLAERNRFERTWPMVVLINAGSASSSEIVAGVLQDYQRAWILGDRTFGKGTVQRSREWKKGFEEVFLIQTIARFFLPSGRSNQIVGIVPDFYVGREPGEDPRAQFRVREEHLFVSALPALGVPWEQPRPGKVSELEICLTEEGKADETYRARQNDANPPDYRLLKALDLLNCLQ